MPPALRLGPEEPANPLKIRSVDSTAMFGDSAHPTLSTVKQAKLIAEIKKLRLMGVSHRVYRTVDPRVNYLRELMSELEPQVTGNPLLKAAKGIEGAVLNDNYFVSRELSINADLYGPFVYAAL